MEIRQSCESARCGRVHRKGPARRANPSRRLRPQQRPALPSRGPLAKSQTLRRRIRPGRRAEIGNRSKHSSITIWMNVQEPEDRGNQVRDSVRDRPRVHVPTFLLPRSEARRVPMPWPNRRDTYLRFAYRHPENVTTFISPEQMTTSREISLFPEVKMNSTKTAVARPMAFETAKVSVREFSSRASGTNPAKHMRAQPGRYTKARKPPYP